MLLGWLEERPDMEAKAMLKRLQASGFGEFPDGQLRTLQRRVRGWRKQIVRQLVYGTEPPSTQKIDNYSVVGNYDDTRNREYSGSPHFLGKLVVLLGDY